LPKARVRVAPVAGAEPPWLGPFLPFVSALI
jgi:hypothetical protein